MQSQVEPPLQRPGAKADREDLTREGGRLYVMALLAAAENTSPSEGEGESAWLAVPGGSAALADGAAIAAALVVLRAAIPALLVLIAADANIHKRTPQRQRYKHQFRRDRAAHGSTGKRSRHAGDASVALRDVRDLWHRSVRAGPACALRL